MRRSTHIGILAILWGLWLLSPFWRTFSLAPTFQIMQIIAPENVWGGVSFGLGILTLIANWTGHKITEVIVIFMVAFFWGLCATAYGLSNFGTLGVPVYGWLCIHAIDTATQLLNQSHRRVG